MIFALLAAAPASAPPAASAAQCPRAARVEVPGAETQKQACLDDLTTAGVKTRGRTISNRRAHLGARCRFRSVVTFRAPSRLGAGRLKFTARFFGNRALTAVAARSRRVRARL